MFRIELIVRPREGVRDPQADAVQDVLRRLGYDSLNVQCVGRYLQLDLEADSEVAARTAADDMCKRLLVNPNLETYELNVKQVTK